MEASDLTRDEPRKAGSLALSLSNCLPCFPLRPTPGGQPLARHQLSSRSGLIHCVNEPNDVGSQCALTGFLQALCYRIPPLHDLKSRLPQRSHCLLCPHTAHMVFGDNWLHLRPNIGGIASEARPVHTVLPIDSILPPHRTLGCIGRHPQIAQMTRKLSPPLAQRCLLETPLSHTSKLRCK